MKFKIKTLLFLAVGIFGLPKAHAVVSIAHSQSAAFGQFLTSTGAQVAAGGVSVGFFNGSQPIPTDTFIQNNYTPGTAYSALVAAGFVDVRTLSGATLAGGFDWTFDGISGNGGTVQNITLGSLPSNPPAGLQLYVVAFNAGNFAPGTPSTSFAGATEWSFLRDTTWTVPPDGQPRNTILSAVTGGSEVIVGTEFGDNSSRDIRMVAAIPEPSRIALCLLSMLAVFARRRR